MTYEVVTWDSAENGAIARIRMPMAGAKGKTKIDWLPVAIHAATPDEARSKAVAFYESELERLSGKAANMEAARAKAAATRAAKREQTDA
jgi:hypothetical protein